MPALEFELRELRPRDRVADLSLGGAAYRPLEAFLKKDAKSFQAEALGKTYCWFQRGRPPRVRGYITLACGEIAVEESARLVPTGDIDYRYPSYPAVRITRLAVDTRLRGYDLGGKLLNFALGLAKHQIGARIGCRFVVVDAKKQSVGFYRKQGFTMLDTPTNLRRREPIMFIDLAKIA